MKVTMLARIYLPSPSQTARIVEVSQYCPSGSGYVVVVDENGDRREFPVRTDMAVDMYIPEKGWVPAKICGNVIEEK